MLAANISIYFDKLEFSCACVFITLRGVAKYLQNIFIDQLGHYELPLIPANFHHLYMKIQGIIFQ